MSRRHDPSIGDPLRTTAERVAAWLDRLADNAERQAATNERFRSLHEACVADARNYRATARDIRRAIAEHDQLRAPPPPRRLCGAVDSDGIDDCGLDAGHAGRHYSMDPAGPIAITRRCLACRRRTRAISCVCVRCIAAGVDPIEARRAWMVSP